jgi:hypothetical protein
MQDVDVDALFIPPQRVEKPKSPDPVNQATTFKLPVETVDHARGNRFDDLNLLDSDSLRNMFQNDTLKKTDLGKWYLVLAIMALNTDNVLFFVQNTITANETDGAYRALYKVQKESARTDLSAFFEAVSTLKLWSEILEDSIFKSKVNEYFGTDIESTTGFKIHVYQYIKSLAHLPSKDFMLQNIEALIESYATQT